MSPERPSRRLPRPLAGVEVVIAEDLVLEGSPPWPTSKTDQLGRFRARGLPAGSYEIRIHAPGRWCREGPAGRVPNVKAGTDDLLLHLIPHPPRPPEVEGGVLEFRVVRDEDGEPVTRARVYADDHHQVEPRLDSKVRRVTRVRIQPCDRTEAETPERESKDGVYREDLFEGRLHLWVEADPDLCPKALTQVAAPCGQTTRIEIRLARGGFLEGSVLSPLGAPRPGAHVAILEDGDHRSVWVCSRPDGRFRIGPRPPGRYALRASHPAWFPVDDTANVRRGETTSVELRLHAGGTVRVRVTDAGGSPGMKALVKLRTGGRDLLASPERYRHEFLRRKAQGHRETFTALYRHALQTDDRGELLRKYVEPGESEVVVREPGVGKGSTKATVREGQETSVDLVLR